MNLQAICVANFTGFILIAFLLISRAITKAKSQAQDHAFNLMMYLVIIACLIEPLTFYMDGKPGKLSYWINILGGTYLYFANGLGSFLFCVYVDIKLYGYSSRIRRIYYKFGAVVACILLSLLINIWGGYYFYVDADKRTSAFNENVGRPYNIGFSIGHDKYDKENDDADSFFKKIDEAMYIDKARVHRERALTNDRRKT